MIKKAVKKAGKKIVKPFQRVSYIDNYVYCGELLKGRAAIITGGTSGIGLAIAKTFLLNDCDVVITGRNQKRIDNVVKDLKAELKNKKRKIIGYQFDISDTHAIQETFDKLIETTGIKIDILVNNAGVIKGSNIGDTKVDDYELCLKTNLEGTYFLSQTFFNYLKSNRMKGNILNICSSSSMRPAVKPYTLTKWGLKGLTIGMAKKFIDSGVIVNGIAPGPTYTPMLVGDSIKEKDLTLNSNPAGRYTTPEEIANGALFLVSNLGKMVVGDIMYMTGGAGITTVDDIIY